MGIDTKQQRRPGSIKDEIPVHLFDLDPNKLDKHCLDQPKLVLEWGIKLAEAKDFYDRAKAALDVAQAEAHQEIAANPEQFDLAKPTVDAIKSAVARHEDVQVAVERLQRAKHKVDLLQAVMTALDNRKRSIEGLIQLHGQEYFSVPVVSSANRERMSEETKNQVRRRRFEDQDD
ncbi:MAG TPA: hypothetical protein PK309_08250 [Bacillota bacterium]|nr:hypothetical protein [Bacillota bacterium]HQD87021.1 hypothetical protein [Bacillota bacterium]